MKSTAPLLRKEK